MKTSCQSDEYFMREALQEAYAALDSNEVPVGALVACKGEIVGRGHNLTETLADATAHAEMQALSAAMQFFGSKYLEECTLYVTLEPCAMCASASSLSHIARIVFGASDPKRGYRIAAPGVIHPKTRVAEGILRNECEAVLNAFFKKLR